MVGVGRRNVEMGEPRSSSRKSGLLSSSSRQLSESRNRSLSPNSERGSPECDIFNTKRGCGLRRRKQSADMLRLSLAVLCCLLSSNASEWSFSEGSEEARKHRCTSSGEEPLNET